ncbi:MAG: UPF0182 family protein [Gemmatimonadota bacterium]
MSRRRWVIGGALVVAALLLVGRVVASWYVDYLWYDALGAIAVWRARTVDMLILRGSAFVVASLFVFFNLYAVRNSVVSLVLPRRLGNLEIGEEVPGEYLNGVVIALSLTLGFLLSLPHGDWASVDLIRHGEAFRESDPYFQFDLAFWVYWLPLETELHLWSLVALLAVALVVVCLYALTPSLRWEGGRLRITSYVRRHFFVLGAALLILLGWSYRLDAYRLLLEGSGALGTFNALDHRVGIPASLALALGTVAAAMLLLWSGWVGQLRMAFATVSIVLLLALGLRQLLPPVAERFLTPADAELRDAPYFKTRAGYTRRAYDLDRIARPDTIVGTVSHMGALRGAALWDTPALQRAMERERRAGRPLGATGWESHDGRLRAVIVEEPTGPEAGDPLAPWGVAHVETDLATEQGAPVSDATSSDDVELPAAIVFDSASGYSVVIDTLGRVAAPTLSSFGSRLAHAWALQNPRLLGGDVPRASARVVLYRNIRGRVRRIFPFFLQGDRVAPIVYRDSLYWSVQLYAASEFYPLSDPVRVVGETLRYFQHAGVAIVNAHSGRVFAIPDPTPEPITASWMRRFPGLFVDASALDRHFTDRIPPPTDATLLHARLFAHVGPRGENAPPSHLPRQLGGDTLFTFSTIPPYVDSLSGHLSLAVPVLDAADRVRGLIIGAGGTEYDVRWEPSPTLGPRWGMILDRLHRSIDSASRAITARDSPIVRGPVRVLPSGSRQAYVQTAYVWRADGTPSVRLVAVLLGDTVRTGQTIATAAGLPAPVIPFIPLSPTEFRARVDALYGEMREAMKRGDWLAFGVAYESLGRVLRTSPGKP